MFHFSFDIETSHDLCGPLFLLRNDPIWLWSILKARRLQHIGHRLRIIACCGNGAVFQANLSALLSPSLATIINVPTIVKKK